MNENSPTISKPNTVFIYTKEGLKKKKKRVTVVHPMVKRQQDTYYGCKDQQWSTVISL